MTTPNQWASARMRRSRQRPRLAVAAALATALTLTAACSSSSSAKSSATTAAPSSGGSTATSATGAPSGSTLYIAGVFDLSGAFGHYGQVALQGVQAAVNVINSSGGLNGHKLAIKSIDDGSDPAKAVIGAKSLISSVPAKDLLYFSPGNVGVTTLAVLPVTSDAKLLTITPSATDQTESQSNFPYTFTAYPNPVLQTAPQVAGLKQLAGSSPKVAMVLGTDSGDQASVGPLTAAIKTAGLQLVDTENVSPTASDYTTQLEKARQAGAAALYVKIDTPSAYVAVMQGIKQLAWTSVKVLAGPTAANAPVLTAIPAQVASQFFALGQRAYMQGFDGGSAQFSAFETALQSLGDVSDIGISTDYGDMVKMAAWAYTTAGNSNDQAKMQTALESLGSSDLPSGTLLALPQPHYSKDDHNLSKADFSSFWALLQPGQPVKSQWVGVPLALGQS
jgi:ABC-type branched-subunit amino acid transport system substrate-binding protein